MDYNYLSKKIHEQNKAVGWWDDPNRCIYECLQLVSTEVAEATEGERKNLMDDKLPHRKMGEVELADALIRILDLAGFLGLSYRLASQNIYPQIMKGWSVGKRHFRINEFLVNLGLIIGPRYDKRSLAENRAYSQLVDAILTVSESFGYDIEGAMREKLEYNKTRVDHKRENRAKEHGKKF